MRRGDVSRISNEAIAAGAKALSDVDPPRVQHLGDAQAVLEAALPYLDSSPAPEGQLFFDHGPSSFLAEVIGIMKVGYISIDIAERGERPTERKVRIEFRGYKPEINDKGLGEYVTVRFGRSYGECLYEIREDIRMVTGK